MTSARGGFLEVESGDITYPAMVYVIEHPAALVVVDTGLHLGHQRVELDGDHDLFGDGSITCLLTDGHTAVHQSVRVGALDATYVLCGRCCYLRRTSTDERLPPLAWDRDRHRSSIRRLAAGQRNGATLLLGHDPEQMDQISRDGLGQWV